MIEQLAKEQNSLMAKALCLAEITFLIKGDGQCIYICCMMVSSLERSKAVKGIRNCGNGRADILMS